MALLQLGLLLRNGTLPPRQGARSVGWAELREMARMAEQAGFDTLFIDDHFLIRNSPPVALPEGESLGRWDSWVLLSALAEATSRVTLGPFVTCTSFRNPALLAKMADSLDEVSGGRLILGLGAGWHRPEFDAFGYPFDHLASRFEEALQIIVPLLREGQVDFHGQYYQARDCELIPRGPRRAGPPIWIGARQPRMLRLAARYADAFNTVWHLTPETAAAELDRFKAACGEVGREPTGVTYTAGTFTALPDEGAAEAEPSDGVVTGSPAQIAAQLHAFTSVGVRHLTCTIEPWDVRAIERFARVIEQVRALEA